jgi:hypothetical protein
MADNSDPRPPVEVSYTISWPGLDGNETDTFEIPRAEWDALTPAERTARIEDCVQARFVDLCGWGWHIYDKADYAATEEPK